MIATTHIARVSVAASYYRTEIMVVWTDDDDDHIADTVCVYYPVLRTRHSRGGFRMWLVFPRRVSQTQSARARMYMFCVSE